MLTTSLGDLAQTYHLRNSTVDVKSDLTTLVKEMTTGRVADLNTHLNGDFSMLVGLERSTMMHVAWTTNNTEAANIATAQQAVLDRVAGFVRDTGPELLASRMGGQEVMMSSVLNDAAQKFQSTVSSLNTRFADRAVFAGAATRGNSLADANTILADLGLAVAGETTAAGVMAVAEDWFMTAGSGFDTSAYVGSTTPLAALEVGENATADLSITAAADPLRKAMKGLAIASLMSDGLLAGDPAEQSELLREIGSEMLNTTSDVTSLQADLGVQEAWIEDARVHSEARMAAFQLARDALIGADPYETAGKLEQVQVQLETLYLVTARISGLSLAKVL